MGSISTVEIDEAQLRAFSSALAGYRDVLKNDSHTALRRGSIDLIKSLRARTVKAKARREVKPVKSGSRAVYVVGRHAPFKGERVKLFRVRVRDHWDYTVGRKISEVKRTRKAQIERRGLAKKSWAWLMHSLFKQGNPARDTPVPVPPGTVRGMWREKDDWAGCELVNRLDYITSALPRGAVAASFAAAERSILFKVSRAAEQAARKARLS